MKELLWFGTGIFVGVVSTWLVLRNNPKFLFRHYEHWVNKRADELSDEIAERLRVATNRLKGIMDKIK